MCPCTSIAKASVEKQQENQPFLHFTFLAIAPCPDEVLFLCKRRTTSSLSLSLQNRILLALFVEWPFVTWS
jgi:hypothetical protein